jgi:hypothetical protein
MSARRGRFGPSRSAVWKQLSEAIGGTYDRGWRGQKVAARHGVWTVTLDTYTVASGHTHIT